MGPTIGPQAASNVLSELHRLGWLQGGDRDANRRRTLDAVMLTTTHCPSPYRQITYHALLFWDGNPRFADNKRFLPGT